jgi:hypothetical protein
VENVEIVGSRAESRRFFMTIAKFEGHCWKDIVTHQGILETYTSYHRETFIGQGPALLAIDLYNLVYEGARSSPASW